MIRSPYSHRRCGGKALSMVDKATNTPGERKKNQCEEDRDPIRQRSRNAVLPNVYRVIRASGKVVRLKAPHEYGVGLKAQISNIYV